MVKLLENTFRAVNIGLVNEIALMCHKMDIDVWEVIDAAKTKPFGFMPFYPGPASAATASRSIRSTCRGRRGRTASSAASSSWPATSTRRCPSTSSQRIGDALNSARKSINGSRIHLFGVAYKRDVNDMRESPALDILELLHASAAPRSATPIRTCPRWRTAAQTLRSVDGRSALAEAADCSVICTDHNVFDYDAHRRRAARLIVDTRNALKNHTGPSIFRL